MEILRITLVFEVPDARSGQGDRGGAAPDPPASVPAPSPVDLAAEALAALQAAGVDSPESYLATYQPARIVQVCRSADRRQQFRTSKAGWVAAALKRGWNV